MLWRLLVPADVHDTDTETERPQFHSLPASSFPAAGALGCGVITHS
jgi:hypothetical protein